MAESGWRIPEDWDGEALRCIRLQWPDSPQWTALLLGLLYDLTRGRTWDADTGVVKDAQAQAWAVFDANRPFVACSGDAVDNGEIQTPCSIGGGLIVIEGDEDMGQVVTNVYVDFTTNQLVVEFGPCCIKRYYLPEVAGGMSFYGDGEDLPDEPEYPAGTLDYTACAQAKAIWDVWVDVIDRLMDDAAAVKTPFAMLAGLQAAYPSLAFGRVQILTAYTAALNVHAQSFGEDAENADWMREVLCMFEGLSNDTGEGWSSDTYDQAKAIVSSIANRHFSQPEYATIFGSMIGLWFYAFQAIGAGDAYDLTYRVVPTGDEDCSCQAPAEYISYGGYYLSEDKSLDQLTNVSAGWTQVGMRHMLPEDAYGVIVQFQPYTTSILTKRMAYNNLYLPGVVDVSTWGNTSENLGADLGAGKALLWFADETIATYLSVLAGLTSSVFYDAGVLGIPIANAGDVIGSEIDLGTDAETITIAKFYYIYKEAVV